MSRVRAAISMPRRWTKSNVSSTIRTAGARQTPDGSNNLALRAPLDRSGMAAAVMAVAIWGMVPVALRYFVAFVDPFAFSLIRFGSAAFFALPFFFHARPWTWPRADIARTALCGFLALPGLN